MKKSILVAILMLTCAGFDSAATAQTDGGECQAIYLRAQQIDQELISLAASSMRSADTLLSMSNVGGDPGGFQRQDLQYRLDLERARLYMARATLVRQWQAYGCE